MPGKLLTELAVGDSLIRAGDNDEDESTEALLRQQL